MIPLNHARRLRTIFVADDSSSDEITCCTPSALSTTIAKFVISSHLSGLRHLSMSGSAKSGR